MFRKAAPIGKRKRLYLQNTIDDSHSTPYKTRINILVKYAQDNLYIKSMQQAYYEIGLKIVKILAYYDDDRNNIIKLYYH